MSAKDFMNNMNLAMGTSFEQNMSLPDTYAAKKKKQNNNIVKNDSDRSNEYLEMMQKDRERFQPEFEYELKDKIRETQNSIKQLINTQRPPKKTTTNYTSKQLTEVQHQPPSEINFSLDGNQKNNIPDINYVLDDQIESDSDNSNNSNYTTGSFTRVDDINSQQ